MTASVQSPEDVINVALTRIGYARRVDNIYEGTTAAKAALLIYAQTRDELLRDGDWGFAERNITMTQIKMAPPGGYIPPNIWSSAYPPQPYFFEYIYPADCLKVRAVKQEQFFIPNFDPQPNSFTEANDDSLMPPAKVILCYIGPTCLLTYTGQVTDPTTWEPLFVEALAAALAERLGPMLSDKKDSLQAELADEALEQRQADRMQG